MHSLRKLVCEARKEIRAGTLRVLRYLCITPSLARSVLREFEWPLICLLELPDSGHKKERLQALQVCFLIFHAFIKVCVSVGVII